MSAARPAAAVRNVTYYGSLCSLANLRISINVDRDSHEVVLERVNSEYNVLEAQSAGTSSCLEERCLLIAGRRAAH